ncbi:adhesion G protein-coupled receptor E5 isoform X1 [Sorex araneus]|uniref:adhesion G protein-coupled receptor E5 isoform X1 n=1 Tax=Sorex araneus TaxID=42254 RepID=UPI002433EDD0|nr:adhesion G protein-coupled receptor E5 isoform X1 [Sorex araneus]
MGGPRHGHCPVPGALSVLLTLAIVGLQDCGASEPCKIHCPLRSSCFNVTSCRCDPGFRALEGEIFTNPLDICEDINECAPSLNVSCGRLADCVNTEGSYHCECISGYRLASGESKFRNKSENTCRDVNECDLEPRPCHKTTHCLNFLSGYKCLCRPGWKPAPGSPNGPNNTICEDVDECASGTHECPSTTTCVNTPGSYKCRCPPGWMPKLKAGTPNTVCQDVDECITGQHTCHNSTVCINTQGAFVCQCRQGWVPKAGFQNTVCEEISFPAWSPPSGIRSQTLSHFFQRVQDLSANFQSDKAQETVKNLITCVDELLESPGDLGSLTLSERHRAATNLLSGLEVVLRTLARAIPDSSFTYTSPSSTELTLVLKEREDGNVTMGQSHARVMLNWAVAGAAGDSGPAVAGVFSSRSMEKLVANASLDLDPENQIRLESIHESPVHGARLQLLSAVNSVFLSNPHTESLDYPVYFAFSHPEETPGVRQELVCAFWKADENGAGRWNTSGCRLMGSANGSSTCICGHLSSFAILMAHYNVQDPRLALITKVGLSLSLICLMLCILTFLLVRPIQGSRTTVHLHLCICLFLGSTIFLVGIENEGGEIGLRCRLVAGLLHYCFLAAFCWMSLEGVELYFLVVRVFQGQSPARRWLYLLGYGVPLLIVGISAAVRSEGYGRTIYCWLNPEKGFLWSFLGPVTFIILCNAIIFITTVWRLTQKFSEINPDMKKLRKARVLTITAMAQLFVLGCTWVFGLFLFDPHSWILSYTFTVLNCLQGLFLFLLHCVLNKKVREEYRKWAGLVTGNKYSEFATTTSGSSQNQTRALRPSESGM